MSNRVVLGNLGGGGQGLRTSVPGANVLNMSLPPRQVSFDSRRDTSSKVLVHGTSTSGGHTVSFGETLPYIPIVITPDPIWSSGFIDIFYGGAWRGFNMEDSEWPPEFRVYNNRIVFLSGGMRYVALRE